MTLKTNIKHRSRDRFQANEEAEYAVVLVKLVNLEVFYLISLSTNLDIKERWASLTLLEGG